MGGIFQAIMFGIIYPDVHTSRIMCLVEACGCEVPAAASDAHHHPPNAVAVPL